MNQGRKNPRYFNDEKSEFKCILNKERRNIKILNKLILS